MSGIADHLIKDALSRWRANPIAFIEECLVDPETRRPFVLLPAEGAFLAHAFATDDDGRLRYPELVFASIKKSGKTTFAALVTLVIVCVSGGDDHRQRSGAGAPASIRDDQAHRERLA